MEHDEAKHVDTELLRQNDTKGPGKLSDHFSFVSDKPCQHMYVADDAIKMTNVRTINE